MASPSPSGAAPVVTRRTYFTVFFALTMAVGIYVLLCFVVEPGRKTLPHPPSESQRLLLQAFAVAEIFGSVAWVHWHTRGRIDGAGGSRPMMTPSEFQTASICGQSLATGCTLMGLMLFFLGMPAASILPHAGLTLAVDLLFILPRARRFWAAWDQNGRR